MAHPLSTLRLPAQLRLDAESRIQTGKAPATQGWTPGADALTLLYHLASDPASAPDALKLLHELQVHQVELDLQHEQMEYNQRELEGELSRYRALYESAPAAYFVVNPQGRILDSNPVGERLIGVEPEHLAGTPLEQIAAVEDRATVTSLLQRTQSLRAVGNCTVRAAAVTGTNSSSAGRQLCLVARVTPGIEGWLVMVIEKGQEIGNEHNEDNAPDA